VQTFALATLAAALYATGLVTTYYGLRHLDTLTGARVSIPTAALLFWLAFPFMDTAGWMAPAVAIFALVGCFYPAAVTLLTFAGSRRLGPTVAGTIGSTTPLFAVLGAALFLGEALGARELAATAAIVLGTMALSKPAASDIRSASRSALWMPVSGALLRSLAQVLSKAGLALWPNPYVAALTGYTVSTLFVWVAGMLVTGGRAPAFNRRGVAWFALTGVLNGSAVLALYYALATGPVQVVAPVIATYPLYTLALSSIFLKRDWLDARLIAGVMLTVTGVILLLVR
jgi:drug/metabolite transporter (DMT)-like permease